jgi:hypothetical protein
VKLVYGIGGELELDVSSMMRPVQLPQLPKPLPAPNVLPTAREEPHLPDLAVAFETVPPEPKSKPRPTPRHRITVPQSAVHGCQFGPGDPGRTGMPRVWGLR